MTRPNGGRARTLRAVGRLQGVALLMTVAGVAIWSGCSVTKQNYKVLSFFFDGVPDPSLPPGAVGSRMVGGQPVFIVVHKPHAQERCDECHTSKYRPSRNDSSICLKCHAAVQNAYPHMHGAVEATACLWCHSPHESSHLALLRDSDRKVCSQCHTPSMLNATRVPAHADAARGCLECHSGHGSAAAFMLKPEVPAAAPTPPPSGPAPEKK